MIQSLTFDYDNDNNDDNGNNDKDYGDNDNNDGYSNDHKNNVDKDDNGDDNSDDNDDQSMNTQIIPHIFMEGFYVLILDSESVLDTFWMPPVFTNHFATFFEFQNLNNCP